MSITSARPRTRGRASSSRICRGPKHGAGVFPARRGHARRRHEEEVERQPALAAISMSIPRRPRTLPISCESEITAVVPIGTISRASSAGVSSVLSRCMWVSISPGRTTCPAAAIVRSARHESTADAGDPAVGDDHVGRLDAPSEDVDDLAPP